MQLGLLANVRGVSHGSPPYLPAPAVLFMSSAEENEGDGFFRVGVTHIIWQHTMRHFTIFHVLAHNRGCGLQAECYQKRNTAAKVEAVIGSKWIATPAFQLLQAEFPGAELSPLRSQKEITICLHRHRQRGSDWQSLGDTLYQLV